MDPYWIKIEGKLGVGVTAQSEEDALALLKAAFGPDCRAASVSRIMDMTELDQGHVVPNMGNWFRRGIWFPLGFEQVSS